ncbi:MAG: alpha-L-rhamnosidase [Bacteroidales bacterium]
MKPNFKSLLLIVFLLLNTTVYSINEEIKECSTVIKGDANWVGIKNIVDMKNSWLAFRGKLDIKNIESEIKTYIAVDSKYWLWINGELVVFEGGLKRGPNRTDTYCDEIDLSSYLKKGENTIAVLVWYFGKKGFGHNTSGHAAMYFDVPSVDQNIKWKAKMHPAFGETGAPHPNYRLPESNIHFDANNDMRSWEQVGYDDSDWEKAIKLGKNGDKPWGTLWKRPVPQWHNSGLINYTDIEKEIVGNKLLVKAYLPRNITITPYFDIIAPQGKLIDMRTDNYKGGGAYNVRTEYITKSGEQEFETYAYMNGHYVIYSFPKDVEIKSLKYRETRYASEVVGSFKCDDPFYNILWDKSINTINVNVRDGIQDCGRERAQWWGDVVTLLGEMLYTMDEEGHKVIEKAIYNLVDWQKEDGSLYSPVPASNWHNELPTQSLASIGKYGFWFYYYHTGNEHLIEEVYPHVKKYMQLWDLDNNGLVEQRKGGWTWLDWGKDLDSSLVYNTWYYMALDAVDKMAQMQSDSDFSYECRSRMATLKKAFNDTYWTGEGYRSNSYTKGYDDRGNALAVVAGMTEPEYSDAIIKLLDKYMNSSPYIEKYALESLFILGKPEKALDRIKVRYGSMVESHITTLWEGWGIGSEGYGGGSYNHGWSGGPLTLMMEYVAGIAPTKAGWKEFKISPQLGSLNSVECKVPLGGSNFIDISIQKSAYEYKLDASFPNRPGIIEVSIDREVERVSINNEIITITPKGTFTHKYGDGEITDNELKLDLLSTTKIELQINFKK